jgi:hypothetical protein
LPLLPNVIATLKVGESTESAEACVDAAIGLAERMSGARVLIGFDHHFVARGCYHVLAR